MFGENTHWLLVIVNHHQGTVRTLVNEAEGFAHSVVARQGDGCFMHRVARFDERHDGGHDVKRDVLWQHHHTPTASHSFGHATSSDGRHVRHHNRNRGANGIWGA